MNVERSVLLNDNDDVMVVREQVRRFLDHARIVELDDTTDSLDLDLDLDGVDKLIEAELVAVVVELVVFSNSSQDNKWAVLQVDNTYDSLSNHET